MPEDTEHFLRLLSYIISKVSYRLGAKDQEEKTHTMDSQWKQTEAGTQAVEAEDSGGEQGEALAWMGF